MTRASLLQLVAHPAALTGPDVRALEELALAFPYCQTAHLLLAKAAHDQGSMLAASRLRRAATYAADRALLRQLIEIPTADAVALVAASAVVPEPLEEPASLPQAAPALPASPVAEETVLVDYQPTPVFEDKPEQLLLPQTPPEEPLTPAEELAEELPAQAPPIRPPVAAEAARLEFGLATQEPAEIVAYRLPELQELPLASPAEASPSATPQLPAFRGLAEVQYAPGEGSRLGFCLVPTAASPAQLMPSAALPPAGDFFAPDALLLAHVAAHQPPAPPKPSSLDLINSFLQRAPAPNRRRIAPPPGRPEAEAQPDLAVRSTRAEPDLASENLAKILVRQGKPDRAIAVYERLMVKHPEKMAYFAAQIDSLRPSA